MESNRDAADTVRPFAPNAVTDVTGFGLLGHAHETAARSGVRLELVAEALPALPGAMSSPRRGCAPAATAGTASSPSAHVTRAHRPSSRRSRSTRRPRAGCSISLPAEKRAVLEATFAGAGFTVSHDRTRRCGTGVSLA